MSLESEVRSASTWERASVDLESAPVKAAVAYLPGSDWNWIGGWSGQAGRRQARRTRARRRRRRGSSSRAKRVKAGEDNQPGCRCRWPSARWPVPLLLLVPSTSAKGSTDGDLLGGGGGVSSGEGGGGSAKREHGEGGGKRLDVRLDLACLCAPRASPAASLQQLSFPRLGPTSDLAGTHLHATSIPTVGHLLSIGEVSSTLALTTRSPAVVVDLGRQPYLPAASFISSCCTTAYDGLA